MSEEEQIKRIKSTRNTIIILLFPLEVLICIVLYMYVSNTTGFYSTGGCTGGMSQQEKDIYNAKVKPYISESVKGSEVISMIDIIISKNQENANQTAKFISIDAKNIEYADELKLEEACKKCDFYNGEGNNSEENVQETTREIIKLKRKIKSSKKYKVEAEYKDGIIYKVIISENEKESGNEE